MDHQGYLYNYALKILGGRRYTVAEMRRKLFEQAKKIQAYKKASSCDDLSNPASASISARVDTSMNDEPSFSSAPPALIQQTGASPLLRQKEKTSTAPIALPPKPSPSLTASLTAKSPQALGANSSYGAPAKECVTKEDIEAIIARLKVYKFLDDEEYATLYIRDHSQRKPQGLMMLKMNMMAKGLSKEIIARALESASYDEFNQARAAAIKKLQTLTRFPVRQRKEKLTRFLASRGFSSGAIAQALNSTLKAFPSDCEEDYQSP
jgi:SOS response regulatory protein OraA/RecX